MSTLVFLKVVYWLWAWTSWPSPIVNLRWSSYFNFRLHVVRTGSRSELACVFRAPFSIPRVILDGDNSSPPPHRVFFHRFGLCCNKRQSSIDTSTTFSIIPTRLVACSNNTDFYTDAAVVVVSAFVPAFSFPLDRRTLAFRFFVDAFLSFHLTE